MYDRDYSYYYSPFPVEEDLLFEDGMLYDVPIDRLQGPGFPGTFGPPGGFPSIPSTPPPGVPGGGQQAGGPPSSPPPAFTPQLQQGASAFAIDPGAIRGCLFRYTYVWLENGQNFWFYPVFVGRTSIAGWRWQNWRWVYFGTDLRRIRSFQCF